MAVINIIDIWTHREVTITWPAINHGYHGSIVYEKELIPCCLTIKSEKIQLKG